MNVFLSCDWGSSSFRLSLVDAANFEMIESITSDNGILQTYKSWKESAQAEARLRTAFYLEIIKEQLSVLERRLGNSTAGIPVLVSGMASSSVGMKQLPYHPLPFSLDGSGMLSEFIPGTTAFEHDILLISGVKTNDDVMRGEETQLIGLAAQHAGTGDERCFILPGTHSKHITVQLDKAVSFKTYMTGEFFELLSKKSILHDGVEEGGSLQESETKECFQTAVLEGSSAQLLNSCFKVRTNSLFEKFPKKDNYHFLSGLLIGAELAEIAHNDTIEIYLCCGTKLKPAYELALETMGLQHRVFSFPATLVEKAAMRGQYTIYENQIKR